MPRGCPRSCWHSSHGRQHPWLVPGCSHRDWDRSPPGAAVDVPVPVGITVGVPVPVGVLGCPYPCGCHCLSSCPRLFLPVGGWGEATYSQNPGRRRGFGTSPAAVPTLPLRNHGSARSLPCPRACWRCPMPAGPGRGSLAPQPRSLLLAEALCGWGRGRQPRSPGPSRRSAGPAAAHTGWTNW